MNHDEKVKELLKQNGIFSESMDKDFSSQVQNRIKKDQLQLHQMKWIMIGLWMLTIAAIYYRFTIIFSPSHLSVSRNEAILFVIAMYLANWMPLLAVISTILYYFRSRRLDRHSIQDQMSRIEELLKRVLDEKKD